MPEIFSNHKNGCYTWQALVIEKIGSAASGRKFLLSLQRSGLENASLVSSAPN
jgi:hypothetical protein